MKNKFLLLTSLLVLIFSSCKNIEQNMSLSETTTVTFATDTLRSIYTKLSNPDYTYTISGRSKSGATFQTDRHYTYHELSYTRFEIQKGTWDFTMNVFTGEEVIFTGTKSVTIDKSSVISIPFCATTGSTASLSVKLNYPENKGVAKITAGLYDSVTDSDVESALTLGAGYVTYTNNDVPAGTNKILKFYFYDCQDVCIASYIEGVYLAAHDNISVERTLSNVNTFAATVSVIDVDGDDFVDSGFILKAVKGDKAYPMTAVSGTNMYTASLPVGTYDVYSGQTDSGADLTITFINGGNTSLQVDYQVCSLNKFASTISSLTEDSTIILTGELTKSDLTTLKNAINNSTYNVNLDLSQTTGLTSIPANTFKSCSNLSGITIPDSVTSIDSSAFYGCSALSSVIIPDSVTSIGSYTFYKCTSLSSITIPDSVTSIGSYAFYYCTSLSSVVIPDSVTSIGSYAFYYCTSLSSVVIPDSVTSIGDYAFYQCTFLSSVTIPDSVTSIGDYAFYKCTSLSSVIIPDSVTSIGDYAFSGSSLSSVIIGNSVTTIGEGAFRDCTSLSSVTIPDSVTTIGDSAFNGCTSLSSVTIPDSVTTIGEGAFNGCTSLSSVTIPDSVTTIGYSAFSGCSSLSSVTIPDSVISIRSDAFFYCTSLSSVTIPDSVTSIGYYAFYGCSKLTSLTFTDPTTWYRTGGYTDWNNKTNGTLTDVSDPVTNVTYFKDTYKDYFWYKLDE